jgi:hypothetical protein
VVQVDRVLVAVGEHLEQVGEVHLGVLAQLFADGLDALLDQVARHAVHLCMRVQHAAQADHRADDASHPKR